MQFWLNFKRKIGVFLRDKEKESERQRNANKRYLYRVLNDLKKEVEQGESVWLEYEQIKRAIKDLEYGEYERWKTRNRMAEMFASDQVNLASVVKARRKREENSLREVKREDGKVVEEQKEVGEAVTEWFKGLFKRKEPQGEEGRNYSEIGA